MAVRAELGVADRDCHELAYRLIRPAFAGALVEATAHRHGVDLDLAIGAGQAGPSLAATATLRPAPERPRPAATDEGGRSVTRTRRPQHRKSEERS
jgi:hypothetical protein